MHASWQDSGVRRAIGAVLAVFVATFILAAPAVAQDMQQQQQAVPELSDEELETFAEAHLEVQEIRAEIESSMRQANSSEEAQALQQEANEKMLSAIEEHGFTVEEYTQIVNGINADAELEQRFTVILDEMTRDEEVEGRRF